MNWIVFLLIFLSSCLSSNKSGVGTQFDKVLRSLNSGTSGSSTGNGGVYGGLQAPDMPSVVQPGDHIQISVIGGSGPFQIETNHLIGEIKQVSERQFIWSVPPDTEAQVVKVVVTDSLNEKAFRDVQIMALKKTDIGIDYGKSVVNLLGLTVISMQEFDSYKRVGLLQVYNQSGQMIKKIKPDEHLADQFGVSLSADSERIISSGIYHQAMPNNTFSSQAQATIYRLDKDQNIILEQVIISKNLEWWNWAQVGISGRYAFLHYEGVGNIGSMVEIYYRNHQNVWNLSSSIDFRNNPEEQIVEQVKTKAQDSVKFDQTSDGILILVKNKKNDQQYFKIYRPNPNQVDGSWQQTEIVKIENLIPKEVRALGNFYFVANIQLIGDELFSTLSFASGGDHFMKERVLILKRNSIDKTWQLRQVLVPPDDGKSINQRYQSSVDKDFLLIFNLETTKLMVYKKIAGKYIQVIDLSKSIKGMSFPNNAIMLGNKVVLMYYSTVLILSIE